MKLVINVPDYIKEHVDDGKGEELGIPLWLVCEIANGTPLPDVNKTSQPNMKHTEMDSIYDYNPKIGNFKRSKLTFQKRRKKNERKKAKKYKRMYEELVKQPQPVRYKIERFKIDTLRFERRYPYPEGVIYMENSNYLREVIAKDIALSLVSSLEKYINYYTDFCPQINQYRICGEIKVVDRSCEKE